ncbi:hypothetical protein F7725_025612 [Dissostichus mawsoni]|uniref:Uncharacterized protein n=1 Tax=Dissostichus mawsoni TaxID=36200 RepID=A0A7J5XDQ8_DISMA|nr:hypothetical protein F7725_025612 [Dissostichus mawsoni]
MLSLLDPTCCFNIHGVVVVVTQPCNVHIVVTALRSTGGPHQLTHSSSSACGGNTALHKLFFTFQTVFLFLRLLVLLLNFFFFFFFLPAEYHALSHADGDHQRLDDAVDQGELREVLLDQPE